MRKSSFSFFGLALIGFALLIGFGVYSDTKVETVNDCKIIDLQQQQLISGSNGNMVINQSRNRSS